MYKAHLFTKKVKNLAPDFSHFIFLRVIRGDGAKSFCRAPWLAVDDDCPSKINMDKEIIIIMVAGALACSELQHGTHNEHVPESDYSAKPVQTCTVYMSGTYVPNYQHSGIYPPPWSGTA